MMTPTELKGIHTLMLAAPSVSTRNAKPSQALETGQPCPGCGEGELREIDGWRYCWRCRYAKPAEEAKADAERRARVPEDTQLSRDVEDMLREDKRKGEPGGGDATGKAKDDKPSNWRPEQAPVVPWWSPKAETEKVLDTTEARSVVMRCPAGYTSEEVLWSIAELLGA